MTLKKINSIINAGLCEWAWNNSGAAGVKWQKSSPLRSLPRCSRSIRRLTGGFSDLGHYDPLESTWLRIERMEKIACTWERIKSLLHAALPQAWTESLSLSKTSQCRQMAINSSIMHSGSVKAIIKVTCYVLIFQGRDLSLSFHWSHISSALTLFSAVCVLCALCEFSVSVCIEYPVDKSTEYFSHSAMRSKIDLSFPAWQMNLKYIKGICM